MCCVVCSALQFYRRTDDVSNDMEEMDTEFQQKAPTKKTTTTNLTDAEKLAGTDAAEENKESQSDEGASFTLAKLLLTAELRRPLFVACMLQVIQQFSGINAVRSHFFIHADQH